MENPSENKDISLENAAAENSQGDNKVVFDTEGSTVFVKHTYNTKKPVSKGTRKRIIICAVSLVLCGAIGVSAFFANKYLVSEETASSGMSAVEEPSISVLKSSDVIKPATVTVDGKSVEVESNLCYGAFVQKNSAYSFSAYYEPASADDSASSSESKTYSYDVLWQMNGVDKELIESSAVAEQLQSCLDINATKQMGNTFDTVEQYKSYYGFDEPTRELTVKFSDGTPDLTVQIGSELPVGGSWYLSVTGNDNIYVVSSDYTALFDCYPTDYGKTEMVSKMTKTDANSSYFNSNDKLARFDSIRIYGEVFGSDVIEFKMSTDPSADYMPYVMTSPYNRPASDSFVASILNIAESGLKASSLFTFEATDENKEICGINNPKCVIEFKAAGCSYKLTIGGMLDDSDALAVCVDGKRPIFKLTPDTVKFIMGGTVNDMFNTSFVMENITTIDKVTFADKTGSYTYGLTHILRDGTDSTYDTTVVYGGEKIDDQSFRNLYQRVLMLSLLSFTTEAEHIEPVLTVQYEYKESKKTRTVEFTANAKDNYHYIAWVDGTPLGEVLGSSVDDIVKNLAVLTSGGTVPNA